MMPQDLFSSHLPHPSTLNTRLASASASSSAAVAASSLHHTHQLHQQHDLSPPNPNPNPNPTTNNKRKRNLPGNPDPDAEVIALSPKSLMATNRFICEICNKGFQRDQNLQLHRRGHNLPWKLKQRSKTEVVKRKVYICPEKTCVHHDPARALGDLTGIKKHFSRKHGEKKWKCEKCSKKYAVQSDWKAHSKICGTREYRCDCGTLFSRKDSFITHRAFCDALAEESARFTSVSTNFRNDLMNPSLLHHQSGGGGLSQFSTMFRPELSSSGLESNVEAGGNHNNMHKPRNNNNNNNNMPMWLDPMAAASGSGGTSSNQNPFGFPQELVQPGSMNMFGSINPGQWGSPMNNKYQEGGAYGSTGGSLSGMGLPRGIMKEEEENNNNNNKRDMSSSSETALYTHHAAAAAAAHMSATALLQKAAQMGSTRSNPSAVFGNGGGGGAGLMMSSSLSGMMPAAFGNNNNKSSSMSGGNQQNSNQQLNELMSSLSSSTAAEGGGFTRDFLGVGAGGQNEGGRRPLMLQQELARFAAMGSSSSNNSAAGGGGTVEVHPNFRSSSSSTGLN
ncbi:Zinc finger protein BALDIBIS [Linum perenne]